MENHQQELPQRTEALSGNFWKIHALGWLVYGITVTVAFAAMLPPDRSVWPLVRVKLIKIALGFLCSLALRPLYRRVWQRSNHAPVVALSALVGSSAVGLIWLTLYLTLNGKNPTDLPPGDIMDFIYIMFGWSCLYFLAKYWQKVQLERQRALIAEGLQQRAQLETLRYQLNPHFLFNALNSIRASIDEDPRRAKRLVTEFSDYLRYSLLTKDRPAIPLKEEIEAVQNYLAIEKIRFEDKLHVNVNVEQAAEDYPIPAFLVQPLVENSLKHGMSQSGLDLQLSARVSAGRLQLEVANTGHWATEIKNGIGLTNVRQRLAHLYGDRGQLNIREQNGWVRATIEIEPA